MTWIKEVIINIRLLSSETVGQLCLEMYFLHITWKILEFCNLYIIHSLDSKNVGLALCNYNWLVLSQLRWQTSTISLCPDSTYSLLAEDSSAVTFSIKNSDYLFMIYLLRISGLSKGFSCLRTFFDSKSFDVLGILGGMGWVLFCFI